MRQILVSFIIEEIKRSNLQLLTQFLPDLISDQLLVAWCDIENDYPADILTPDETDEWSTFKNAGRRQEYLATRWLIRQMARQFEVSPTEFVVDKDMLGKPFGVYEGTQYHISIAHTDTRVLAAISTEIEIGVDLEPLQRRVPDRLRRRIVHSEEKSLLSQEPTIRVWTLKEALVKLQGTGMRTNLGDCEITSVEDEIFLATLNNDNRAKICSFQHTDHWFAIAWNS